MVKHEFLEHFNKDSVKKEINILCEDGEYITNRDIAAGSFTMSEKAFDTGELSFGSLVANEVSVKIFSDTKVGKQKDKVIDISLSVDNKNDNPFLLGKFKVASDKMTSDRNFRILTAYDKMYDIIHSDVTDWYESLAFPIRLKAFRDSFCTYLGIEQAETTLINDTITIQKTISATALSGQYVLAAICDINCVFGRIDRNGKLKYVALNPKPSEDDRIVIDKLRSRANTYEEYVCKPITMISIRNDINDVGVSVGSYGNTYMVQDNFLTYGKGNEDLNTIANRMLNAIGGLEYRPFSACPIHGNPCYEIGDPLAIKTTQGVIYSYMFSRTLTGVQNMTDSLKAEGNEVFTEKVNGIVAQTKQLQKKTNVLERTVEETKSTITDLQTEIGTLEDKTQKNETSITQNANYIEMLASKTTEIEGKFDDYATIEQLNSSITQTAKEITLSVSESYSTKTDLSSAVNGIEVGGRNLLEDTNWVYERDSKATSARSLAVPVVKSELVNLIGKEVTLSFYIHSIGTREVLADASAAMQDRFGMHGRAVWEDSTGTKAQTTTYPLLVLYAVANHSRVPVTQKIIPPDGYDTLSELTIMAQMYAKPASDNDEVWLIGYPKLEVGNKATDWTPAPEDVEADATTKADNALTSAKADTDAKLQNYSTTTEMNSAITQKADSITTSVNKQITETKTYADTVASKAESNAKTDTANKLKSYSTTTQMNSAINQSAESINAEVRKKVGDDEVISKINQSAETITIKANKIDLTGYLTISAGDKKYDQLGSASAAKKEITDNIYVKNTTTIDGGNIATNTIKATSIDVNDLFAQNITATGTIKGATLEGANITATQGRIGGFIIEKNGLYNNGLMISSDGVIYITADEAGKSSSILSRYGLEVFGLNSEGKSNMCALLQNMPLKADGNTYVNGLLQLYRESTATREMVKAIELDATEEKVTARRFEGTADVAKAMDSEIVTSSSEGGQFRRYDLGAFKMLVGYKAPTNYAMTSAYGSGYFASFTIDIPSDVRLTSVTSAVVSTFGSTGLTLAKLTSWSTSQLKGYIFSTKSETLSQAITFTIFGE